MMTSAGHDWRKDFPTLDVKIQGQPLVYFDNAATTLKPNCVIDAVADFDRYEMSNVHRGLHTLSEQATGRYESVRETVRDFINADQTDEIIFTSGTTDSINLLAHSFGEGFIQAGDEILITAMEHHSNIVPWQMLCQRKQAHLKVLPVNDTGDLCLEQLDGLLTKKTKLVSVVAVSNTLGTINPISDIIAAAHAQEIPVFVDAAQAITAQPVDVKAWDCDFLAFSAHKAFAPTGLGVLYGKASWLDRMPPFRGGGDMIESVSFEKTTYNDIPYKFEAGTPHISGVIGLGVALTYFKSLDLDQVFAYKKALLDHLHQSLKTIEGLRIIGEAKQKTSVASFVIDDIHPHDLATLLDQQGVAIRTGHHCTQPLMDRFGIPATSRASLMFYNTHDEIDFFIKSILEAQKVFKKIS